MSSHFNWGLLAALVSYQQSVEGDANALTLQPFVFRNQGQGCDLRSSGNIIKVYVEPQVSVYASGDGQPEFQVFAGFNIQFPGKPKVAAGHPSCRVTNQLPDP